MVERRHLTPNGSGAADVGFGENELREALDFQPPTAIRDVACDQVEPCRKRVDASQRDDLVPVMTPRFSCASGGNSSDQLHQPKLQRALAHVRLVPVDVDAFEEDLSNLKFPHERFSGFFLLAPDLFLRAGIDAKEWVSDSKTISALGLDSLVRGQYATRRRAWLPVTEDQLRI